VKEASLGTLGRRRVLRPILIIYLDRTNRSSTACSPGAILHKVLAVDLDDHT